MKKVLTLLLALILILASLPLVSTAEQKDDPLARYVNTGNTGKLNVRSAPKSNADNLIAQLENGTRVVIIAFSNGYAWAQVEFPWNGKTETGYVQNRYLSMTKPAAKPTAAPKATPAPIPTFRNFKHVEPTQMFVKPSTPGGFVNLRWAPSKSAAVMDKLYADTQVIVIAHDSTWAQVYDPATGYVGFMMLSFLK